LVEQVGGSDNSDDAPILDDQQAAERLSPHQVSRLAQCGSRTGTHGIGGHQITNRAVASRCRSSCAAKVAFRDNANETPVLHHDKMTDPVLTHGIPSDGRGVVRTNGDHFNAHHVS
jgi:hypothetical protein